MTRSTQKKLAAYEGTWFGNNHGNIRGRKKRFLMTDWLEVRVLPAPPRSLTQTEISQFSAKPAGHSCPHLSLQSVDWISRALSGPLSLPRKIAFPDGGDRCWWRLGSNAGSVGRKAEHLA
jgi:hypothetical protein